MKTSDTAGRQATIPTDTADYPGKRVFDLATALLALTVTAPLWPVIALAIRIETPGPVFYRATRVGRGGTPFSLLKFRSMRTGSGGPGVTARTDARITRVGRVLRKSKLDEVPQLINVLRGEMSLVGPRPEDARYLPFYSDAELAVLSIRPGITGAASVAYRHEENVLAAAGDVEAAYRTEVLPAKLALELEYLTRRSLISDVRLLVQTVLAIGRRAT